MRLNSGAGNNKQREQLISFEKKIYKVPLCTHPIETKFLII